MKYAVLLGILFDLLAKRAVTAREIAERYEISARTVYRYVETLSACLPVKITRGRNGGIRVPDNFKLPVGFMTEAEYAAAVDALDRAYAAAPQKRFLEAKRKLTAAKKQETRPQFLYAESGALLLNGEPYGDTRTQTEKMRLLEFAVERCIVTEIEYEENGERLTQKIEPHLLAFDREAVFVFAFCHTERAFRLLPIGRILTVTKTKSYFRRRPFRNEEVPLSLSLDVPTVDVCFLVQPSALERASDWLGATCIRKIGDEYRAEASLADTEALPRRIAAFGDGLKVLSPLSLQTRVKDFLREAAKQYE